jgi:hypothetical protein
MLGVVAEAVVSTLVILVAQVALAAVVREDQVLDQVERPV